MITQRPVSTQAKAFTIVELLVVIAVISLLVSILLPVLSRAREVSERMKCIAYLHGIGTTEGVYANDYKGYYGTGNYVTISTHNTLTGRNFSASSGQALTPNQWIYESGVLLLGNYAQTSDLWCPVRKAQWTLADAIWSWDTYAPPAQWYSQQISSGFGNFYVGYDFRCEGSNELVRYISPDRDPLLNRKPLVWDDVSGGTVPWTPVEPPASVTNIAQYSHPDGYNTLYGDLSAKWISDPNWQALRTIGLNDFSNGTQRDVFVWNFLDLQ